MKYFKLQLLILFQQFYSFVNSQENIGQGTTVPTSGCDAISDEEVCFTYFTISAIIWGDARLECVSRGYDIATVTSTEENTLLYSIATSQRCWIGLHDIDTEGTFGWADGNNSTYRNWAIREPNNQNGNEDCVQTIENERWNDLPCTWMLNCYICRASVNVFGQVTGSTYSSLPYNAVLTSNTTLYCVTENKNTPQVMWSYEDLSGIKKSLTTTTDASTGVSIIQVFITQPGYYMCEVSQNGGMNTTYTAVIAAIPVISSPIEDIAQNLTDLEDFPRTLECSATGLPAAEVYWSKSMDISEQIGTCSMLEITSVLLIESTNVFYCVAVNSVGMDVVTVTYVISVETVLDNIQDSLDSSTSITPDTALEIVKSIQRLLQKLLDGSSLDNEVLTTIVELIEQVVDKINGTFSDETTKIIAAILDTVINSTDRLEQPQTEEGSIATEPTAVVATLRTLEKFASLLLEDLLTSEDRSVNIVQSGSIVIINQVVNLNNTKPGNEMIKLPLKTVQNYSVSLSIPLDAATDLSTKDRNLFISTSIVTRNPAKKAGPGGTYQASDILTASIIGQNGTINLRNEVPLRFDVTEIHGGVHFVCVSLNGSNWESTGITTTVESGVTICKTNHFTSFAVFVTPYKRETGITDKILSILSYILVSISFISLIISLLLFIIAGKAFFKVETNIIYFNYCISLLIATGVFLFGIQSGKFNRIFCMIVAFLLHYTWLAVFTWSLCIGILIMFKLVIDVMSTRKIYPYLIVFGWVFPLIIPLVTVIVTNTVNNSTYVDPTMHCFLSYEGGVIWSFIAPVMIILIINVVFLVIAIAKIVYTKLNNPNNEHKVVLKDALITALVLTPVLGVPWLILILNVSIQHVVLEFVFIFLNSVIGVIFLFVVVLRNKEVHNVLCKRRNIKDSGQPSTDRTGKCFSTGSFQVSSKFKITTGVNTLEKAKIKDLDVIALENQWVETK